MTKSRMQIWMEENGIKDYTIYNPSVEYIKEILNTIVMDAHTGKYFNLDGIVVLTTGEVCPFFVAYPFCLNPLGDHREDGGDITLSTCSISGTVMLPGKSAADRIIQHNQDMKGSLLSNPKLIKEYHCKDYSIIFNL